MPEWVSEWQGMVFAPTSRYTLRYDRVDTTIVPFGVANQSAMAERVSEHPQVHVTRVERSPFSDDVQVTVVTGEGIDLGATRELFPVAPQVEAELAGAASYELNGVRPEGEVTVREAKQAEEREQQTISNPTSTGEVGAGLNQLVSSTGGLLTLTTIALLVWAVVKALDLVE